MSVEFIIAGAIAGVLLAIALFKVIWVIVSDAVDNLLRWVIYNFGSGEAVARQRSRDERPSDTDDP